MHREPQVFSNMRLRVATCDISLDAEVSHQSFPARPHPLGETSHFRQHQPSSAQFAKELEERLPGSSVPQIFVNGLHFGDHTKVMQLNETGDLKRLLAGFQERPNQDCTSCGGIGFVNCTWCRGEAIRLPPPSPSPPCWPFKQAESINLRSR